MSDTFDHEGDAWESLGEWPTIEDDADYIVFSRPTRMYGKFTEAEVLAFKPPKPKQK